MTSAFTFQGPTAVFMLGGGVRGGRGAKKAAMPGTMPSLTSLSTPVKNNTEGNNTNNNTCRRKPRCRTHARRCAVLMTADGGGGGGGGERNRTQTPHYQPSARPAARPRPPSPAPRALLSSRAMKSGCAASRASTWSSIQRADRRPLSSRAICFTPFNSLAPLHGQRVPGSGRRSIQR